MDDARFDALLRSLGAAATRRGVLTTLAGVAGLAVAETTAKRRGRGRTPRRAAQMSSATSPAKSHLLVTICHRTGSKKKPFQVITVAERAVPAHAAHGDLVGCPAGEELDPSACVCRCAAGDPGPGCDPPCACGEVCKVVDPDDDGVCCQYHQQEDTEACGNGGDVAPFSCTEVCGEVANEGGEEISCSTVCGSLGHCGHGSTCVASQCCGHPICVPTCGPRGS